MGSGNLPSSACGETGRVIEDDLKQNHDEGRLKIPRIWPGTKQLFPVVLNEGQPQIGVDFRKTGPYHVYMEEARLLSCVIGSGREPGR